VVSALRLKTHNNCDWAGGGPGETPNQNFNKHFEKHGDNVGAKTSGQYSVMANRFRDFVLNPNNSRFIRKGPVDGHNPGVIRHRTANKYIDLTPDGKIVSFGTSTR
jgi:pyocin large subunit-like protein